MGYKSKTNIEYQLNIIHLFLFLVFKMNPQINFLYLYKQVFYSEKYLFTQIIKKYMQMIQDQNHILIYYKKNTRQQKCF